MHPSAATFILPGLCQWRVVPKSVLDIAVVAAVLSLVVSVNGDLLSAGEANEGGVRLPLDLVS